MPLPADDFISVHLCFKIQQGNTLLDTNAQLHTGTYTLILALKKKRVLHFSNNYSSAQFSVSNLLLTSLLAGTDGPAEFSAVGLWAKGEEGLSSSGISVVTTSTVSTGWICVSAHKKNKQ